MKKQESHKAIRLLKYSKNNRHSQVGPTHDTISFRAREGTWEFGERLASSIR